MKSYKVTYKKLPTVALLKIIAESVKYEPEAIEAAHEELTFRELSPDDIINGKRRAAAALEKERLEVNKRELQAASLKTKIKNKLDKLNPFASSVSLGDKYMRYIIAIMLLILSLSILESSVYLLRAAALSFSFVFRNNVMIILLILVTYLFFKKVPIGWILLTFISFYLFINVILGFWLNVTIYYEREFYMDTLDPSYVLRSVFNIILYAIVLLLLIQPQVYKRFSLRKTHVLLLVSVAVLGGFTMLYGIAGDWFRSVIPF